MLRGCTAALPQKSQTSATEELQPRGSGNNASCENQVVEGFATSKTQGTCFIAPLLHTCWPQASPHTKLSCPPCCAALLGQTSSPTEPPCFLLCSSTSPHTPTATGSSQVRYRAWQPRHRQQRVPGPAARGAQDMG